MNRKQAEQLANELTEMLPASVLFYADENELVNKHGIEQIYIDAMNWLNENQAEEKPEFTEHEITEARKRIENGSHSNSDLDLMIKAGLARQVGDCADQFSGAGIVWIEQQSDNLYSDNYEEVFVTRGQQL